MRAKEFLSEAKSYKPFIDQCKDLLPWLKTEFVKDQMTKKEGVRSKVYTDYVRNMVLALEEAIKSGRQPAARRIMRVAIPSNADYRDAKAKAWASPSRRIWGTGAGRAQENERRYGQLKAMELGMKVRSQLNFDVKLDKPPRPKEQLEKIIHDYEDAKARGDKMPNVLWRQYYDAQQELKRYGNES